MDSKPSLPLDEGQAAALGYYQSRSAVNRTFAKIGSQQKPKLGKDASYKTQRLLPGQTNQTQTEMKIIANNSEEASLP